VIPTVLAIKNPLIVVKKGNLKEYFALDSWDWQQRNIDRFGRVMRLWGLFGTKQLWVSDPLALHYIFVKEAHLYDVTTWGIE
jgi:hypothetical protein